jgi:hypothetical protein
LAKTFKSLRDKNQKYDDHTIRKIIEVWVNFQKKHDNKPDDVRYNDFDQFYKDYKRKYDELKIRDQLDESFLSERALMQELFGKMYEDTEPDESPDSDTDPDTEESGDAEDAEEGGSDGDGSGESGSGSDDESKYQVKIFVLPMKHLSKAFSRDY